tara:strand:- start:1951 stop:2478 length:528 start_codon:yes stop_codon:yes gene_type:complete
MQPTHTHNMAIEVWCEDTWGEPPVKISDWATHDDVVQVLIRLSASVLIADFRLGADGSLHIHQHLHIPLEKWNPGSIQGLRTSEGKTRFQHRRQSIYLSSELRVPEWGAALLEDWLMSMRGAINRPKDRIQRINEVKRLKLSVERNLENASMEKAVDELGSLSERLASIDQRLAT